MLHPRQEARWQLRDPEAELHALPRFPRIIGTVLSARGIRDRAAADIFYKPHLAPDTDPMLLPDMDKAVERVQQAIARGELIGLYGDFDVDGVTSLSVLTILLGRIGAKTLPYIPDRFNEGYGVNSRAVEGLAKQGVTLMITADCGISSVEEVERANSLGMDVIILDHHTVPPQMPAALATVNPKRLDSEYPFNELAAVGVSYRFGAALYDHLGLEFPAEDVVDLVALGTVADVAPLEADNRRIVVQGLSAMRANPRPGLQALLAVSDIEPSRITAESFGFALGPRLNAAGRLKHARRALELLLAPDLATAIPIAEELGQLNRERQRKTELAMQEAAAQVLDPDLPLIMVGSPHLDAGIVGLVAARLAEHYHRPAIAYQEFAEESRASARSIPEFNIVEAIRKEADLLVRHGGHRAAAGFTVRNENVDELRERLVNTAAELLDGKDLRRSIVIDAEAELCALTRNDIKGIMQFEPCGHGNTRPILLSRGVQLVGTRTVGKDGSHRQLTLRDGPHRWRAIAFRQADRPLSERLDVVYSLKQGWKGDTVELEVLDFAPSEEQRPLVGGAA